MDRKMYRCPRCYEHKAVRIRRGLRDLIRSWRHRIYPFRCTNCRLRYHDHL